MGHYGWTPGYDARVSWARARFDGQLGAVEAQGLVRESRASFLLVECGSGEAIGAPLRPPVSSGRRFGCDTVDELRPPA